MIGFIDKFLKLYYVGMLVFTVAAVIAIFIRVNADEVYYEEVAPTEQEQLEASDSIELVGSEAFQNFDQAKFSEYLVVHHKQVLEEGFVDTEIIEISRAQKLLNAALSQNFERIAKETADVKQAKDYQKTAESLRKKSIQTEKEEFDSNYSQVGNWFYPVIHRLRKEILYKKDFIDTKNFSYEVFRRENHYGYTIREKYIDLVDASRSFYLDWYINIKKNIDGFTDDYTSVKYTQLTATLSFYEDGDQPNHSPKTVSSLVGGVALTNELMGLLITKRYREATKLLNTYSSIDVDEYINKIKNTHTYIEKNSPVLTSMKAIMPYDYGYDYQVIQITYENNKGSDNPIYNIKELRAFAEENSAEISRFENDIPIYLAREPVRIGYDTNYEDSRFDKDYSVIKYDFLLTKKNDGFIISDGRVDNFSFDVLLSLEDIFFSMIIVLTLLWSIIMLKMHFGFKSIIKDEYPAIYEKLGKSKLTGNDNWTPYITNHEYTKLGNSTIDMYGTHLSFVYTHIRTYLMMMILVISVIKLTANLA